MKLIRISALWCPSCLVTYNIWNEIKEKYPDFEYIEFDYDSDEEIIQKYEIGKVIPVIIILKDDKEITRIIGEKKKKEVFEIVDKVCGS